MKMRNKLTAIGAAATLGVIVGTYAFTAASEERDPNAGPPSMHRDHGMMGPGMMMGTGNDPAMMAQMRVIHELVANHDRIKRTVTNLADGIRTVTESDDPRIAGLIKEHVASMGRRVGTGKPFGLPIESPALRAIYENKDKIQTNVETTAKGTVVTQTSSDPQVVAVLQQHATEVSELVRGGMAAMHTAMMRNRGAMMHGPMMRGMPGME